MTTAATIVAVGYLLSTLPLSPARSIHFTREFGQKSRSSSHHDSAGFAFKNIADDTYTVNVSLSGQPFLVQLDTGSSDLWLDTTNLDLSPFTNTGFNTTIKYADGTVAAGPILEGNITLGNFTFSQAFISAPGSNATHGGIVQGILGLGKRAISNASEALAGSNFSVNNPMQSLFTSSPSTPQFTTLQLSRTLGNGTLDGGVFTIGETHPAFSNVTEATPLPVLAADAEGQWTAFMDGMIVNGQNFSGQSRTNLSGQQPNQAVATIDSGTSLAGITKVYMDAIYADVPGAELAPDNSSYSVPCDAAIPLSFIFGGVEFLVDPIDTVIGTLNEATGEVVCLGAFMNVEVLPVIQTGYDLILGDTFMRNIYIKFNYGSFVPGNSTNPSMQMISVTNATQALLQYPSQRAQANASLTSTNSPRTH